MQSAIVIRQDERMPNVPRCVASGCHIAAGRTVAFPKGLIIVARYRALVGVHGRWWSRFDGEFVDPVLGCAAEELLCTAATYCVL